MKCQFQNLIPMAFNVLVNGQAHPSVVPLGMSHLDFLGFNELWKKQETQKKYDG